MTARTGNGVHTILGVSGTGEVDTSLDRARAAVAIVTASIGCRCNTGITQVDIVETVSPGNTLGL
jgi:hypothetical protein